jgi:GTPase SAR1 family protein
MSRLWKWMGYSSSKRPENFRTNHEDVKTNVSDADLHDSVEKFFENVPDTAIFSSSSSSSERVAREFKIVVIGKAQVGKTTFLKSVGLTGRESDAVYSFDFQINDGSIVRLKLSDGLFTGKVDGAIYMYDITDSSSFQNLLSLKNHFAQMNAALFEMPSLLIGNKCDLYHQRQVSKHDLPLLGMRFLEISAETGENVQLVFKTLIQMLMGEQTFPLLSPKQ